MRRREILCTIGGVSIAPLPGCTTGEARPSGNETSTNSSENPSEGQDNTATEPSCREAVYIIAQSEEEDIESLLSDTTIDASLVEETGNEHYILLENNRDDIEAQVESGASLRFIGTLEWCSQEICDAQTFLLLRDTTAIEEMQETFSESVAILSGQTETDEFRLVYSTVSSVDTLTEQANQAGYETATAVAGKFSRCS